MVGKTSFHRRRDPQGLMHSGSCVQTDPQRLIRLLDIFRCRNIYVLMARAATNSDAFNAVAEPRRRDILNYLAMQERAVGDIADQLSLAQPSVSKHLRVLLNVGLVRVRREGR